MVRRFGVALVVFVLPACAINTPSPGPASFSNQEIASPRTPAPAASYASAQPTETGSGIATWWNSIQSSFGTKTGEETASAASAGSAKPRKPDAFDPAEAQRVVNAYRAQKGLKPLKLNPKLIAAARKHSEDLAKSDRISHFGADGSDTWERVRKAGYGAKLAAENVGTGQQSMDELFESWRKSGDHNANLLLREADEMGIAMVYNPGSQFKTFWTMVVARSRGGS